MSQNSLVLPTTGTVSGLQMTQFTNNAIDTLNTMSSGASAPASPEAGQLWHDTTNNILKLRSLDNTSWIPLFYLNESSYLAGPPSLGQITGSANRILNGAMQLDQVNEGGSYSLGGSPLYTVDQWIGVCNTSGASGVTAQRSTDAPTGYPNSLKVTVTTGGAVATGDYCLISQPIEGNNVNDLALGTASASAVSLSFWVKSSVTGTFAFALMNSAENRVLVNKFTISSANTWTQITFANIPGDITGTWLSGTSIGLQLFVCLACGATYQTSTLGSWQAGPIFGSTSQTNSVLTTSGATFQITGVMLNAGAFCYPYEKRTFQTDLYLCERYYEKSYDTGTAVGTASAFAGSIGLNAPTTSVSISVQTTPKRADSTVIVYSPNSGTSGKIFDDNATADVNATGINPGQKSFTIENSGVITSGHLYLTHWSANARM